MDFGEAIKSGFSNYVNFSDRASRSEYWFWSLFSVICTIVAYILDARIGLPVTRSLFELATFLPSLAVGVRRLHDLDRSGWWMFLFLIPLIGAIVLIVWFCTQGTDGENRFGADPLGGGSPITPRPAA
jgi:uncharacterized membrane protein YhaH (DUF805 family)